MKKIILTLLMWVFLVSPVSAAELLMFSSNTCGFCLAFLKDVAPDYIKSPNQGILPLKIIDIDRKKTPQWFTEALDNDKIDGIRGTPTFVIFDNGSEIARLVGYQGKDKFNKDINNFIATNTEFLQKSFGKNEVAPRVDIPKLHSEGSHHKEINKLPNGVVNSQDIRDHIYKSETMAEIAGLWLGCRGTHTHIINGETIWMPCTMGPE